MVRFTTPEDRRKNLINDLFREAEGKQVCPHIKRDNNGEPYCGKNFQGKKVSQERRMICDHISLQMWCLAPKTRYQKCIYYQGEPID